MSTEIAVIIHSISAQIRKAILRLKSMSSFLSSSISSSYICRLEGVVGQMKNFTPMVQNFQDVLLCFLVLIYISFKILSEHTGFYRNNMLRMLLSSYRVWNWQVKLWSSWRASSVRLILIKYVKLMALCKNYDHDYTDRFKYGYSDWSVFIGDGDIQTFFSYLFICWSQYYYSAYNMGIKVLIDVGIVCIVLRYLHWELFVLFLKFLCLNILQPIGSSFRCNRIKLCNKLVDVVEMAIPVHSWFRQCNELKYYHVIWFSYPTLIICTSEFDRMEFFRIQSSKIYFQLHQRG